MSNIGLSKMMGWAWGSDQAVALSTPSHSSTTLVATGGTRYWMECGSDYDSDSNDARQTSLVSAQIVSQVDAELKNMIYQ